MSLPDLGCACANLRRAARLVTALYSKEMGSTTEPAQYALLSALERKPGLSQTQLGRALGLDKTTLSRNFKVLQKNGWIELAPSQDKRERGVRLTSAGADVLAAARPGWERAQTKLREALPPGQWENLFTVLAAVTAVADQDLQPLSALAQVPPHRAFS